jgi:GST-like protein
LTRFIYAVISIAGDQFISGFVAVNPNSKIPAVVDLQGPGDKHLNLFESGSIMLYLADKFHRFIPQDPALRAECLNWVFWQMAGLGPMCGNFGHFMVYAPADECAARDYGVARYGMESQRLLSVLDQHLAGKIFMVGEEYTIADMVIFPWFHHVMLVGYKHASGIGASDFLSLDQYKHANAWAQRLLARPEVQRGLTVCTKGVGKPWLETNK